MDRLSERLGLEGSVGGFPLGEVYASRIEEGWKDGGHWDEV